MNTSLNSKQFVVNPEKIQSYCRCGQTHPPAQIKFHAGDDAYDRLASDLKKTFNERPVLVIDDENTHAAAGEAVVNRFRGYGIVHDVLTLTGSVSATLSLAEKLENKSRKHHLIVAVGAGTINDLGKYAAGKRNIPYWSVPTAPSMNGYTSAIAAIKKAGVKRTIPANPPEYVYVHPEVIQKSPLRLQQSGFCDVLAKSVSDMDWKIESILFSGSYCPLPSRIVAEVENRYQDQPDKIPQGDEQVINALLNGLLVSGVAMSLAGSSAPASGGEHLVSHFLDMREDLTGRSADLHGFQVALGIILSSACYRHLSKLDHSDLKVCSKSIYRKELDHITDVWGELSDEVEKRYVLKRDHLVQLDALLPQHWPEIQAICLKVRQPRYYVDLIRKTGFPLTLRFLGVPKDEFLAAARTARTIRERITILDIAAQAGILESATDEALALLQ